MENIEELWAATLSHIEQKISKPSFDTWLKNTKARFLSEEQIVIDVPNEFARDWLEGNYTNLIANVLYDLTGAELSVKFVTPNMEIPELAEEEKKEEIIETTEEVSYSTMLNPKYTFETFVIGAGNRFAHAASLAVAEAPAKAYNPLFIYGGVGLGKTHLMHAIGHYVQETNPDA